MSTLSHIAPAIILLLSVAGTAWAHTTTEPAPESFRELWTSWPVEPVSWFALGLLAWFYLRGLRRIWRAIGVGCGLGYFEVGCFAAGWLALAVALVSPLHPWGKALFSAHMTQHEILMLVAAPLAVLGRPVIAVLKGFSPDTTGDLLAVARAPVIRQIIAFVASPFVAWAIHAAVLWAWHIPACFQATLTNDWIHALQHTTFLFSALLFWWAVLHGHQKLMGYGAAVLYMFTTALHSGLLGALLTFANATWYSAYAGTTQSWGLSPLEDQRLGGLIMWVPAGLVYVVAGLALFAAWLRESEKRVSQWEAQILADPSTARPATAKL